MTSPFYFTLKAIFVLKVFQFLSWISGHAEKGFIRNLKQTSKFVTPQLYDKQSQYRYCQMSQKVKAIRQWNLVSWLKIAWETHIFWKLVDRYGG